MNDVSDLDEDVTRRGIVALRAAVALWRASISLRRTAVTLRRATVSLRRTAVSLRWTAIALRRGVTLLRTAISAPVSTLIIACAPSMTIFFEMGSTHLHRRVPEAGHRTDQAEEGRSSRGRRSHLRT
jgi:hypothetical protein